MGSTLSGPLESSRLAWLTAAWSEQRQRLNQLWGKIGDLGVVQGMKPKTFHKFLRMMSQVAVIKEDEARILSEIEAIERKHRLQRKMHCVKYAGSDNEKWAREFVAERCENEDGCERPVTGWLWWEQAQKLHEMLAAIPLANPISEKTNASYLSYEAPAKTPSPALTKQKARNWFLWIIVFWYLMSRPAANNSKTQSLTVD